jgi:hypothetical protein
MKCYHCNAPTTNGLALCDMAQAKASADLEFLPVYFRNLARWRPGRAGSRPVPGSREPTDAGRRSDRIELALDAAENDISTWARMLADDRGVELPDVDDEGERIAAVCRLLTENLTSIATLEWCGEFVKDEAVKDEPVQGIGFHESRLRNLTEVAAPGWYAGSCRHCQAPTHVVPGLTWVRCLSCGCTTYARDHLEIILDEARDWVARPKHLADAVVALVDTELSVPRLHDRIRQWGHREQIAGIRRLDSDGDEVGPKRYRLGDVLDLLSAEGGTRLDDGEPEAVPA